MFFLFLTQTITDANNFRAINWDSGFFLRMPEILVKNISEFWISSGDYRDSMLIIVTNKYRL